MTASAGDAPDTANTCSVYPPLIVEPDIVGLVPRTVAPVPVDVVTPVPPLATARVPVSTIAPVVAVEGVNPVTPALKLVTPPPLLAAVKAAFACKNAELAYVPDVTALPSAVAALVVAVFA